MSLLGKPIATRVTLAIALAAAAAGAGLHASAGHAQGGAQRPNVVVVMTDDQDARSIRVMNNVKRVVGRQGVTFRNSFASYPLCCPSRVTFLTGQYAHNHGVLNNGGPDGGFATFEKLHDETLATQLQDAGYRTAYVGKYLNGYPKAALDRPLNSIPDGWNRWFGLIDPGMYDWSLNANGLIRRYGSSEREYQTDVLARLGADFIRARARRRAPFLLTVGTNAPHGESGRRFADRNPRPARRHYGEFENRRLPRPPSFNEADVSDKPEFLQVDRIDLKERRELRDRYRGRLESLLAVDELVLRLVRTLRREGELGNTLFVFTSDNGFLLGEHRLQKKRLLYEESARVPLIVRGPGLPHGVSVDELAGNVDLAPTIYDASGVAPPGSLQPDGVSLLDVAENPPAFANRDLLLENWHLGDREGRGAGVRTSTAVLIEQTLPQGTSHELYDLDRSNKPRLDPDHPELGGYDRWQLENQYGNPRYALLRNQLENRLDDLRDCAGNSCH